MVDFQFTTNSAPILTLNSTSSSSLTLLDMYASAISGGNGSYMRLGANSSLGNHMQVLYQHFANADTRNNCSLSVGTASITLANNGNIGIGTASPSDLLTLNSSGASNYYGIRFCEDNNPSFGGFLRYHSGQDRFTMGTLDNNSPVEAINISRTSGFVGIGITNPSTRLHVMGSDASSNTLYLSNTDANKRLAFFQDATNNVSGIFSYNYGNSSAMNLVLQTPGGNVGVGTVTPY